MNINSWLKTVCLLIVVCIMLYLWRARSREYLHQHKGWNFILTGFSLTLLASLLDIIDNFDRTNLLAAIGDQQTFLQTTGEAASGNLLQWLPGILQLCGLILLFIGLTHWFTTIFHLHRSETKLRALYESTSDAVMLLDQKGFFDCNNATLVLFGCADLPPDFSASLN